MSDQAKGKKADSHAVEEIRRKVEARIEEERSEYGNQLQIEDRFSHAEILRALNAQQDGDSWLFRHLHEGELLYDHADGDWYEWDGHHWRLDRVEEAMARLDDVVEVYGKEARRQSWLREKAARTGNSEAEAAAKELQRRLLQRIGHLQRLSWKKDVLRLAAVGKDSLGISGQEWDKHPLLLGCRNGVVDLETGNSREGKPEEYLKTVALVNWEGLEAPAPTWESFLEEIFDHDRELGAYVQRLLGYAVTGLTQEHILPIFWGDGRNGKGTLLETLGHVLGPLVGPMEAEMLLAQKFTRGSGGPASDIMALRGRRLAWASETDQGRRLNASKVKWLVGGDTLVGRSPYGRRQVEFEPTHTLILLTNHKPQVSADDFALWQRIHLVPFTLKFVDNPTAADERQRDPRLARKLRAESSGILAWLVRGCLEWQRHGLNPPEVVKAATAQYRAEEDLLGQFLQDCCREAKEAHVKAGVLYKRYKEWCEMNGHRAISSTKFGKYMKRRFDSYPSNGINYIGIGLVGD